VSISRDSNEEVLFIFAADRVEALASGEGVKLFVWTRSRSGRTRKLVAITMTFREWDKLVDEVKEAIKTYKKLLRNARGGESRSEACEPTAK